MEGILPIWKEAGMTSHDVVYKLRKILKTKKIGHSGTLDPAVDGVLPVAVGKATKVIEYMVDSDKIYKGEVTLGIATSTEDATGEVVDSKAVESDLKEQQVDDILDSFIGEISQTPPYYSAVKVNGKRLYEYAREGKEVERPTRKVTVKEFKRLSPLQFNEENQTVSFTFEVLCGKGTYVRTLAVDAGAKLGYPAHMSQLTREASGGFSGSEALTLDQVKLLMEEGMVEDTLYPLEHALKSLAAYELSSDEYELVRHGSRLPKQQYLKENQDKLVFMYQGQAVAIYGPHPTKEELIKPLKVLKNELQV
ncbi:tRNA pseudouridine(55) synthase TruB [Alkalibacterium psychrotolerans]